MDTIKTEKLILSLIKDDLINTNLIFNLRKIGLHSDCYYLNLSSTIFDLMGFTNSEETDEVFHRYVEMTEEAAKIDITETNKMLEKFALQIYRKLEAETQQ
jgi:hypothetical protein